MSFNTTSIIRDQNNNAVPQYYNPTTNQYEVLEGQWGANRVLLYDANGNPLLTAANMGYVGATDGAIATLGALADAAQTSPTAAASVIALLKGLIKQLQGAGAGSAPTDVVDRSARALGKISADDGAITTLGAIASSAVTDPTQSATVVALLKGLLKQLQGTGTGSIPADVIDRAARILGKITADDGAISTLGALANSAVTDPTASASVIAVLKGLLKQLQGSGTGSAPVQTTANPLSPVTTLQNAATATGTGTPLPVSGYGVAVLAVSGTFAATITVEGQGPDGAWYAVGARQRGAGSVSTTITTPGLYEINCLGLTAVRANITSYTSGSVMVKGQAQPLPAESGIVSTTGLYGPLGVVFPDTVINVPSGVSIVNQMIAATNNYVPKRMMVFLRNNTGINATVYFYPGNTVSGSIFNSALLWNPSGVSVSVGSSYGYSVIENLWKAPNSRGNSLSVPAFVIQFLFQSALSSASTVEIEVTGLPG